MTDKNSMLYWYPKIVDKVPTPRTSAVLTNGNVTTAWIDEGAPAAFVKKLKEAAAGIGYPVFMRTEQLSAKHQWSDTCFVESEAVLARHLYSLIEAHWMTLDMQMDPRPQAVFVREFLKLKAFFTAYEGMPVAREFRFFATKGVVDCYHPYWPHQSIAEGRPSIPNWRDFLPALEAPPPPPAVEIVMTASRLFPDQMSLDVCELQDGRWMLTDMATGKDSFHWRHGNPTGGGRHGEEGEESELEAAIEASKD